MNRNIVYLKNNQEALKLFFRVFSYGININFLPLLFNKLINDFLESDFFIFFIYYTWLDRLFFSKIKFNDRLDSELLFIKGRGKDSNNEVKLIKDENNYVVEKIVNNKDYDISKKFYRNYKDNKTLIYLPKCNYIDSENKIEMEFIESSHLEGYINRGVYNYYFMVGLIEKIIGEIKKLYNEANLIHGDLGLRNIYLYKDSIYIIDYEDAHLCKIGYLYDAFCLIYKTLKIFDKKLNFENVVDCKFKDQKIYKYLGITKQKYLDIISHYKKRNRIKHGE